MGSSRQLGIRPLYYSLQGNVLRISDDLNRVVVATPQLTINESWVAGFVGSGYSISSDGTVYNEIKRLPPAHYLVWSQGKLIIHRYWTLPFDTPPRYGSEDEICEDFRTVLDASIRDNLPDGPCGLMLSGGLDSPTLAAEIVRIRGSARELRPHTRVIDSLMEDDERSYVDLIGKRLGFTPRYVKADGLFYDPEWKSHFKPTAEPNMLVLNARLEDPITATMAEEAPVWFEGEGPDNALVFEWHAYLRWLAWSGQWRKFFSDSLLYMARKPAIEWVNHVKGLAYRLRRPEQRADTALLSWANPGFRSTLEYALTGEEQHKQRHPWHPRAFSSFQSPIWQNFLESYDPTVTGTPIEWRHPYLDLRVLEFMLSLPSVPWGRQKYLLRKAMADRLPREVLTRRKTPLQGDPWKILLQRHPLGPLSRGPIEEFFDLSKLPLAPSQSSEVDRLLRIHILDSWLRNSAR
jgi:asparagine synthase (glutamine-hydrolysing)